MESSCSSSCHACLAGVGVSVGGGTSFFRLGTIVSRFTGKAAKVVYRIQGIPVTQQEIQAGVALRVENGETVKTAKKEVIKDIITKRRCMYLQKRTDVLCRIRNMMIMQNC